MAPTPQERLVAYLKNAHALEQMSLQMTQLAARTTKDQQLRQLFEHHHQETQEHERLIRQRIEAHGQSISTIRDVAARVAAVGKGAAAMLPPDSVGRLARDGYVQEETEIASYELLSRVAERAGDNETAEVARRILQNERETAEKIAGTWDHVAEVTLASSTA